MITTSSSLISKRKRSSTDIYPVSRKIGGMYRYGVGARTKTTELQRRINSLLTSSNLERSPSNDSPLCILSSGDILSIQNQSVILLPSFYQENEIQCFLRSFSEIKSCGFNFDRQVSFGIDPDDANRMYVVLCSEDGDILFAEIQKTVLNATVVESVCVESFQTAFSLTSPTEKISSVEYNRDRREHVIIMGTNKGNIFIAKKGENNEFFIEKLDSSSNQNIFFGIFKTGAKLFGINSLLFQNEIDDNEQQCLKILKTMPLVIDSMRYLVVLAENGLSIWNNWLNVKFGKESSEMFLHVNTLDMFALSTRNNENSRLRSVTDVKVWDAFVLPNDIEDIDGRKDCVLLCVLYSGISETETEELFMQILKISLRSEVSKGGDISALNMFLISDDVSVHIDGVCTVSSTCTSGHLLPRLYAVDTRTCTSSTVYVSWISKQSGLLFLAQLDIFGLLRWTNSFFDSMRTVNGTSVSIQKHVIPQYADDSLEGMDFEITGISADDVSCLSYVHGVNGMCILRTDGSVLLSTPVAQTHPVRKISSIKSRFPGSITPEKLLSSLASKDITMEEVPSVLLARVRNLPRDDKKALALKVSADIANRAPGTGLDSSGREGTVGFLGLGGRSESGKKNLFVRDLMVEKLEDHTTLVNVLDDMVFLSDVGLMDLLYDNHQKIAAAEGLCFAIHEAQQRSNIIDDTDTSGSSTFTDFAYSQRLQLQHTAIQRLISSFRGFENTGMTTWDVFFTHALDVTEGFVDFASLSVEMYEAHVGEQGGSTDCHALFAAVYGVACSMLTAMQRTLDVPGSAYANTAFIANHKVRNSLLEVVRVLDKLVEIIIGEDGRDIDILETLKFGKAEKKKIKEICEIVLKGYSLEAACTPLPSQIPSYLSREDASTGFHMQQVWKTSYENAKSSCINLLLRIGTPNSAFYVSTEFAYHEGIMKASLADPEIISNPEKLQEVVREDRIGLTFGTFNQPFAKFCLFTLEKCRVAPALILKIGSACPAGIFDDFLQSRPQISWLHYINKKSYDLAEIAATSHANTMQGCAEAQTLYSIAKLSQILATKKSNVKESAIAEVSSSEKSNKEIFSVPLPSQVRKSVAEVVTHKGKVVPFLSRTCDADISLAVINAQEQVYSFDPELFSNAEDRLNPDKLLVRLLDHIETLIDSNEDCRTNVNEILIPRFTVALVLLAILSAKASSTSDMKQPKEIYDFVKECNVKLWAFALAIESAVWVDLSTTDNDPFIEAAMRKTLFFCLLKTAVENFEAGKTKMKYLEHLGVHSAGEIEDLKKELGFLYINKDLIPTFDGIKGGAKGYGNGLLEQAILQSNVCKLVMDVSTGELVEGKNDRVARVIQVAAALKIHQNK